MSNCRIEIPITIRYRDLDTLGHVNNAVYASYFELGRACYFREVLGIEGPNEFDFVIARLEIDFLASVTLFDRIHLGVRVPHLGNTSFTFEYALRHGEIPVARGKSIQVFMDHDTGRKKAVPEEFLLKVTRFEGAPPC